MYVSKINYNIYWDILSSGYHCSRLHIYGVARCGLSQKCSQNNYVAAVCKNVFQWFTDCELLLMITVTVAYTHKYQLYLNLYQSKAMRLCVCPFTTHTFTICSSVQFDASLEGLKWEYVWTEVKVYLLVVGVSVNGLCWIEENRNAWLDDGQYSKESDISTLTA